ncbi:hypothetical protein IGJ41_002049 [Enterococcus sp. DIV1537a]|uniref:MucBP domain-containing protein n=1 Tax=Enterococcus sp. DIV1537a TaxID=2774733 RepID=UPI003F1F3D0E
MQYDGTHPGTYVWETRKPEGPVEGNQVVVYYEDKRTRKNLSDPVSLSGNIGEEYTAERKKFPGYTFSKVEGSATGKFTDKVQTVKDV